MTKLYEIESRLDKLLRHVDYLDWKLRRSIGNPKTIRLRANGGN